MSTTGAFVDTLAAKTNDPIWRTIAAVHKSRNFIAAPVVLRDYERWWPFVENRGLRMAGAVDLLRGETGPLWLALYFLAFRIRTVEDAYPAGLDLAYAHLASAPKQFHGPLLIVTLAGLSRFNLLIPTRRVIDTFLTTELAPHSELYFNLFLQALTISPTQAEETAQSIALLLKRMQARKLELSQETYNMLLNDKLVTSHLAHSLHHHMSRTSTVPTNAQLEAYLRIFAKGGSSQNITKLYSTMHDRATSASDTQHEDLLALAARRGHTNHPLDRANKIRLSSRANPTAAADYLQKLLHPKYRARPKPVFNLRQFNINQQRLTFVPLEEPLPDTHAFTAAFSSVANNKKTSGKDLVKMFEEARTRRHLLPTTITYTILLQALYERGELNLALKYWNEFYNSGLRVDRLALGVGVRLITRLEAPHIAFGFLQEWGYRRNLTKPELDVLGLKDGEEGEDQSEFEPTPAPPTAGTPDSASVEVKDFEEGEGQPELKPMPAPVAGAPDTSSAGLKNHEEGTGQPENDPIPPPAAGIQSSSAPYRVSLSIITLNDWLSSLNLIFRPDVVFAVWDSLLPIYNVAPDARTLTHVLAATRRALRIGETSFKAIVVRMKYDLRDTFGFNIPQADDVSMEAMQFKLEKLLGPVDANKPNPYTPSLWHGRLPVDQARLLFLQAMFGAAPDPEALMAVTPAARATRREAPGVSDDESWGGGLGLTRWREQGVDTWEAPDWESLLRRRKSKFAGSASVAEGQKDTQEGEDSEWQWESYHPSIIPTDETFLNYILLIGLTGRASEIARVLAWMRHLKVAPQRSTLSAALFLWGEVCGRALIMERYARQEKRKEEKRKGAPPPPELVMKEKDEPPWMQGPLAEQTRSVVDLAKDEEREKALAELAYTPVHYARLVTWLHEWVPIQRMPGPRSMALWSRNVDRFRDGMRSDSEVEALIKQTQEEEGEGEEDIIE
ncbi:hypothetical protein DXG01_001801 [Tephrocybe rancida]|nr:hypothetical protein DXG01_001801 [Tephrocybe rancida]